MVDANKAMRRAASAFTAEYSKGHRNRQSMAAKAFLRSLERDGWQCMPRVATDAMEDAGVIDADSGEVWTAMADAAPRLLPKEE